MSALQQQILLKNNKACPWYWFSWQGSQLLACRLNYLILVSWMSVESYQTPKFFWLTFKYKTLGRKFYKANFFMGDSIIIVYTSIHLDICCPTVKLLNPENFHMQVQERRCKGGHSYLWTINPAKLKLYKLTRDVQRGPVSFYPSIWLTSQASSRSAYGSSCLYDLQ